MGTAYGLSTGMGWATGTGCGTGTSWMVCTGIGLKCPPWPKPWPPRPAGAAPWARPRPPSRSRPFP